jgi:hypothetical protein
MGGAASILFLFGIFACGVLMRLGFPLQAGLPCPASNLTEDVSKAFFLYRSNMGCLPLSSRNRIPHLESER